MERLLQGLDELDDLAAAALFYWHRAARAWLGIGLAAALLLHVDLSGSGVELPALLLAECALGSVVIWGVGGLIATAFERKVGAAA